MFTNTTSKIDRSVREALEAREMAAEFAATEVPPKKLVLDRVEALEAMLTMERTETNRLETIRQARAAIAQARSK